MSNLTKNEYHVVSHKVSTDLLIVCYEMPCGCDSPLGISVVWCGPLSSHHSLPKQFTQKSESQEQWLGPQTVQQNPGLAWDIPYIYFGKMACQFQSVTKQYCIMIPAWFYSDSHNLDSFILINRLELRLGFGTDFLIWFHSDSQGSIQIWFDARNLDWASSLIFQFNKIQITVSRGSQDWFNSM